MILICHWLLHAFGIIAITELKEPAFHGSLLCLVPFPSLFYLITVKYTDPVKIKAEIQYWQTFDGHSSDGRHLLCFLVTFRAVLPGRTIREFSVVL